MQLECPNCTAVYEVPDDKLGTKPRRVRCARCSNEWTFDPAAPPSPASADVHESMTIPAGPDHAPSASSLAEIDELERILAEASLAPARGDAGQEAFVTGVSATGVSANGVSTTGASRIGGADPFAIRRDGRAVTSEQPSRLSPLLIAMAWLVTILLLGAIVAAALTWRADIEAAWPPSGRVYHALGLP